MRVRFTRKRCKAWSARKKTALASNKYSYTYVSPPITTRRMTEGGTGVEVEGAIEEVGGGDPRWFSLYAQWGKERGRGKKKR